MVVWQALVGLNYAFQNDWKWHFSLRVKKVKMKGDERQRRSNIIEMLPKIPFPLLIYASAMGVLTFPLLLLSIDRSYWSFLITVTLIFTSYFNSACTSSITLLRESFHFSFSEQSSSPGKYFIEGEIHSPMVTCNVRIPNWYIDY